MFSTIGTLVANSVVALGLLSTTEAIAASAVLTVALGGLVVLAWLGGERAPTEIPKRGSKSDLKKAA